MSKRRQRTDPRTVAREMPGLFDVLFPQLLPGLVVHLNRRINPIFGLKPLPNELLEKSKLNHAFLFELAYVKAEKLLAGQDIDWNKCVDMAIKRQRRYYDAVISTEFTELDHQVVRQVSQNLFLSLQTIERQHRTKISLAPPVPGSGWIASGKGDYAFESTLIEAKCTSKRFSSADYRQVLIYWLLSYAAAVEGKGVEWKSFILINPRLCFQIELHYDDLIALVAAERTKLEILQLFNSLVEHRWP